MLTHLHAFILPPQASAELAEELRKLIGFFENNRHRTDYPTYRANGWDIGSGPTEAGALGGRRRCAGGCATRALHKRPETVGRLLGTTTPPSGIKSPK